MANPPGYSDPSKSNVLFPGANNTSIYNQAQGQPGPQGAGVPNYGDTGQRFQSPGGGTQSWSGKFISHVPGDTRTKYQMMIDDAQKYGVIGKGETDLSKADMSKMQAWQAQSPYWFGAASEYGMTPPPGQLQQQQQISQLINQIKSGGIGAPLYSPGDVSKVEGQTIAPFIENIRKDMVGNAQKYGGSADVKNTSTQAADALAAGALNYPALATEQNNIAQNAQVASMLNRLLGSLPAVGQFFTGQYQTPAAAGSPGQVP